MSAIQIGETETSKDREYIGVDFKAKRVYLFVGKSFAKATPYLIKPDSKLFHKLAPGWQSYCRKAWRKMKGK